MGRRVFIVTCAIVAGLLCGYLTYAFGVVGAAITVAFCAAIVLYARVYMPYRVPWRTRAALLKELAHGGGPPADAQATQSDLFARMQASTRANDWESLFALLTDDFRMIDANGRRWGARIYVRTLQLLRRAYPDLTADVEAIVVDPASPDVLWIRANTRGHPRHGPALDSTAWTRLTVTPDHRQAKEVANGGVIRVA